MATNDSINVHISADTSGFSGAIGRVQSSLQRLQSMCSSAMSGVSRSIIGAHNSLSNFANGLHSSLVSASNAVTSFSAKLFPVLEVAKTIGGVISGVVGTLWDFGSSAVKASADMETMKAGLEFNFEKQLGDTAAAKEKVDLLVSSMQKIGEMSAYDSGELLPMARSWVNIGDSAETAIAKMRTIVDAGSAYNLTGEEMERVNLALTQMQMKGKMQAEEMMQLTEAGIPAWKILSETMGLSTAELQDMASKGQLTQEAMAALFNGIQEQCGGATEKAGQSLSGMFANIREAVGNSMSTIGDLIVQGLNIKGILGELGDFTSGFVEHLNHIKTNAEEVGVGQAITDELNSVGLYGVADFVESVIGSFENIWTVIQAFLIPAIERFGGTFEESGSLGIQICTLIEGAIEFVIIALSGIIDIIGALINAWQTWWNFLRSFFKGVGESIYNICNYMADTFGGVFAWIRDAWNKLRIFLEHPLDFIINVIWFDTKSGESTEGNKKTSSGNTGADLPPLEKFKSENFGGGSDSATFGGGGGGSAGRSGSGSGGRSGGGSSHTAKEEPWEGRQDYIAEVAKQADEAAKIIVDKSNETAEKAKNSFGSILDIFKTDELGNTLKAAYDDASKKADKAQSFLQKIRKSGKNEELDAYGKVLEQAAKKAAEVGAEVQKFREYQQAAIEEAAKYNDDGEKTLQFEQKRSSLLKQIADLQEKIVKGKAKEDDPGKLEQLQQQLARDTANFEIQKTKAKTKADQANAAAPEVEQAAQESIAGIQADTKEKLYSRETQLEQANHQLKQANMATELDQYIAMMTAKGEYANQNYAQILAQEEALNAQRQVWHEQLMMNAMEWADFMSMTFANLNQQLVDGLSNGLAECIVQGKTLGEVLQNLAANLLQTLINNVMKKWLTSLIGIGAQTKTNAAAEIATAKTTAVAETAKTGALTQNAIAAGITAKPFIPPATVAAETISAIGFGKTAFFAYKADGGLITGAGTSTSDSIPAMLSNGEFVMRAEAVNRLGTSTLYALNEGKTFHYSDGGQVGTGSAGTAAISSPNVTLNVSALDASGFEGFLLNGGLDTIRQALYDNNRNFGAAAGVF